MKNAELAEATSWRVPLPPAPGFDGATRVAHEETGNRRVDENFRGRGGGPRPDQIKFFTDLEFPRIRLVKSIVAEEARKNAVTAGRSRSRPA